MATETEFSSVAIWQNIFLRKGAKQHSVLRSSRLLLFQAYFFPYIVIVREIGTFGGRSTE